MRGSSTEYDPNISWRHEVRIEDRPRPDAGKAYPTCTGGDVACPLEDCGGDRDDILSLDSREVMSVNVVEIRVS